jgi:3-phenylpropionate/cinnamic acid dioxygenase small subunit
MSASESEILNLLYRYAEYIDSGDIEGAVALLEHATVLVGTESEQTTVDASTLLEMSRSFVIIYDDGTPRTRHVITNPIVAVDESAGLANCRSYYTVFQQTPGFPLQPIVAGRYHDRFERADGEWRFSFRNLTLIDLVGDMSHHGPRSVDTPG